MYHQPQILRMGRYLCKNITKYLREIISSDDLFFLQETETRILENNEEINEEVNAVVLAAQLVRYADFRFGESVGSCFPLIFRVVSPTFLGVFNYGLIYCCPT